MPCRKSVIKETIQELLMLRNQKGISVYWILSAILFVALIIILALPHFFNLDKEKNVDDCTNNMKSIWVATTDYIRDHGHDFGGDLELLRNTPKVTDSKNTYLTSISYCPEIQHEKTSYIVYGKYVEEKLESGELKQNMGVIVVCPDLEKHAKHFLDKNFYENMSPTVLQNYMTDDLDYIDQQTKSNGSRKMELVKQYIQLWKTDANAFNQRKADKDYLKRKLFPEAFQSTPDFD